MIIREQILSAIETAIKGIEGLDLVWRDPPDEIPAGTAAAVCMWGGDVVGYGDAEKMVEGFTRGWPWSAAFDVEFYVYTEAARAEIGNKINGLVGKVIKAVWSSQALRNLFDDDGGVILEEIQFHPPDAGEQVAASASMLIKIVSLIDPSNP